MTLTYTPQDAEVATEFISASNSLAFGMAREAVNDISRLLHYVGHCILELWLDTSYSTAIYLQELKENWL